MIQSSDSEDEPSPVATPAHLNKQRPSIQLHPGHGGLLSFDNDSSSLDEPHSPTPSRSPIPRPADPIDPTFLSTNLTRHVRQTSEGNIYPDSLQGSATDLDIALSLGTAPLEARQLYLAIARCIAYPFNAKFQVDTSPPKPKLTEKSYGKIYQVLNGFIKQEKESTSSIILSPHELRFLKNKQYQDMLQWFVNSVLSKEPVKDACCHGFFSTQELIHIFKVAVVQKLSVDEASEPNDTLYQEGSRSLKAMEGDPKYQLWVGTFTKVIEQSEQLSSSSDQQRQDPLVMNAPNKETLYALFQEALEIKRAVHQTLSKTCQLSNIEEQEDVVRKELQRRNELIKEEKLPACENEGKVLSAILYDEQRRAVKQLTDNLEKASLSSAQYHSPRHMIGRKKGSTDSGTTHVSKSDLQFSQTVKVTVESATDIGSAHERKQVFVVFELVDGPTDARATDTVEVYNRQVTFEESGQFTTNSPLPQVRYSLRTQVQSLLRDDKVIGKVTQTVSPSTAERSELLEVTKGGDSGGGPVIARLRVSTFLEQPASIRRCGYMYSYGSTMFKQHKQRFFTLTQLTQFKFVLCHYQPRESTPQHFITLDGWTVEYHKKDCQAPDELKGMFWFVLMPDQGQEITFGCQMTQERENWVKWLARATGQAVKPQEQEEVDTSGEAKSTATGWSSAVQKLGLEEVVSMDSCLLPHNVLFTKLFHAVLNYRLQQPLFSRGFFSPGEMYIVDEYCARYCVRLIHRHMTCLWEWLQCELHGESIWPSMMLHSFGYCQMHLLGQKPAERLEVATPQERSQWIELCQQLEMLLLEKLENFRYCFPFSCPKNDLKVTMKLFTLVCEVNVKGGTNSSCCSTPSSLHSEVLPTRQLIQVMERAALTNYKQVYQQLIDEQEGEGEMVDDRCDRACLSANQLCLLGQLCIDFMYELHGFYQEDFTQFPQAFIAHIDAFWSFFLVDLHETMLHDQDTVILLKMFHSLNLYFCSQPTLHLGKFHLSLLVAFQPLVNNYLEQLSTSMSKDLQRCFAIETWLPCKECCTAMQGCIDALQSVKMFVEELHWPEELFAARLVEMVQEMCIARFVDAVKMTKLQCKQATSSLQISLTSLLPKSLVTMINTVIYLSIQISPFSGLASNASVDSETANILSSLQAVVDEVFIMVITKLTDPLVAVLDNLTKFDPTVSFMSFFKKVLPGSVSASGYCKFVENNLSHLSGTMVTAGFSNFVLTWYDSQLHLINVWLADRPELSLHQSQQQTIEDIVQRIRDHLHEVDIPLAHLNTQNHSSIEDRLRKEHSKAVMSSLRAD